MFSIFSSIFVCYENLIYACPTSHSEVRFECKSKLLKGTILRNTGGPRYSRTFYLRISLFAMSIFQSKKMDFSSANSRFAGQKNAGYVKTRKPKKDLVEITFLAQISDKLICLTADIYFGSKENQCLSVALVCC